jgi:prepilin-type processing-associated H-X9-DG protein
MRALSPRSGRPTRRRGIKVIELMVAVAIIAFLLFLLPYCALESREAARRSQCVYNLKQLGLAQWNFVESRGVLPPTSVRGFAGNDFSMKVHLLPFLESSPLYSSLNQSLLSTDPENWTGLGTLVSSFVCPSDDNIPCGREPHPSIAGSSGQLAYASYANNIGTFFRNNDGMFDGPAYAMGAPRLGPALTIPMIVDGCSQTVMFSEWIRGRNGTRQKGLFQVYAASSELPAVNGTYPLDTRFVASCRSSKVLDQTLGDHKGQLWMRDNCGEGGGYSHVMPPNQHACLFRSDTLDPFHTMIGASSNHPGGVNVAFIDGSVKFLKDEVSPAVWRAIATYAGREALDPMNY